MPKNAQAEQADSYANLENHAADVIEGIDEQTRAQLDADAAGAAGDGTQQNQGAPDPAAATAQQAQTLAELEAPVMWPQAAKDAWKALHGAPGARAHLEALHGVHGQTQRYVTQIEQQNAQYRRNLEPIGQMLAPYAQEWARQGMDVVSGVRQLMYWNDALSKDPQGAILQLAEQLGVDLAQATAEQPYVDPVVSQQMQQLQQRIAQQDERWRQAETQQQQQMQTQLLSSVQAFEHEKDAQGNPKHPHFKEVLNDMLALYQWGRASSPEDAYALAVQLNPTLQAQAAKAAAAEAVRKAQANNAQVAQTVAKSGLPRTRPDRGSSDGRKSIEDHARDVIAESQS